VREGEGFYNREPEERKEAQKRCRGVSASLGKRSAHRVQKDDFTHPSCWVSLVSGGKKRIQKEGH